MQGFQERLPHLDSAAQCPSCGRFVGVQAVCPCCGARVSRRLSLRGLHYVALVLAVMGLLALWVAARRADVPPIRIQDIDSTMNWAHVRLRGTVIRYPSYDEQSGTLLFWIHDGTGDIMVTAYRNESRALIEAGKVPLIGDQVTVEGTLKIKDNAQSLIISIPEHISAKRPAPLNVSIGGVTAEHAYQKVRLQGQVRRVRVPYEGLVVLVVRDETGEIDVIYGADLVRSSGQPIEAVPGDSVSVQGMVTLYRGGPQIALDAAEGLRRLTEDVQIASRKPIGEIGPGDLDRSVRIEGAITDVQWMTAGQRYVLADGTGTITLILWQNVLDEMPGRADLGEGTWLDVQGRVSEYKGELEVVPELAFDIRILQVQPATGARLSLSEISAEYVGAAVVTEGQIVRVSRFSSGTEFTLQDGQATLSLVFWEDLLAVCTARDSLVPGAWVSILGEVKMYRGELEIVPGRAEDVVFLRMRELPQVERRIISSGNITTTNIGQVVTIEGKIVEIAVFSSGVKSYVDDGSGRVAVWVPQDLYAGLPNGAGWIVNSTVRVTGEVEEYKSEVEIVPRTADDVIVLTVATPPPIAITRIGELSVADKGQRVTVEGAIVEIESFSSGVRCTLDDGSGQIVLLLWQNVYDILPDKDQLVVGAKVRVTGKVDEYRGELEVVPAISGDVLFR